MLDINVPWQIPRIDPSHFTSDELEKVIHNICGPVCAGYYVPAVDFLWTDIACIDQRRGPLASLEVGSQATIFNNAAGVAVWLSKTGERKESYRLLQESLSNCVLFTHGHEGDLKRMLQWDVPQQPLRTELLGCIREFIKDPWFTSLWTLQEAFLAGQGYSKHAFSGLNLEAHAIISQAFFVLADTEIFKLLPSVKHICRGLFTLSTLTDMCRTMLSRTTYLLNKEQSADKDLDAFEKELRSMLEKSAITAMATGGSPLNLLALACHRKASEDTDHVYAIMRVFGYRLGASKPGVNPHRWFDREDLEDQLGEALFADRSVQSQLLIHTKPAEQGKGWRVSRSSTVPFEYFAQLQYKERYRNSGVFCHKACVLTTKVIGSRTYGYFEGQACWLAEFNENTKHLQQIAARDQTWDNRPVCKYIMDASQFVTSPAPHESISEKMFPNNEAFQQAYGKHLEQRFQENCLAVLHLGYSAKRHFGFLMLHVKGGGTIFLHRLGTVTWNWHKEMLSESLEQLEDATTGEGAPWQPLSGLFG